MDAPVRALSAEDLNILALENDVVAGHTCKVIMLREGISAERLRAMLASRISRAPELSMRLEKVEGAFCWVPTADIDLQAHVVACETGGALDGAGLRCEVARIFAQRLDRSRPLWQVHVVGEPLERDFHHGGPAAGRCGRRGDSTDARSSGERRRAGPGACL